MNMHKTSWALLLLVCAAGAQAQLYKWVGPDGKVTYSDTPPSGIAKQVETKSMGGGGVNTGDLPYELQQAVRSSPVTLYTTNNCIPCDEGRKLLSNRGVPFAEKTVNSNDDTVQFRKVAGNELSLPVLMVGRQKQRGFEPSAWNSALSAAGYPESSKLPKSYHNPAAEPAAPKPTVQAGARANASAEPAAPGMATEPPPPAGNAPPGFRF
jgi:glutaredoxin